jgi:hypothetical protein
MYVDKCMKMERTEDQRSDSETDKSQLSVKISHSVSFFYTGIIETGIDSPFRFRH